MNTPSPSTAPGLDDLFRPEPPMRGAGMLEPESAPHRGMAVLRESSGDPWWIAEHSVASRFDQIAAKPTSTHLGMPTFPQIAGRSIPNPEILT